MHLLPTSASGISHGLLRRQGGTHAERIVSAQPVGGSFFLQILPAAGVAIVVIVAKQKPNDVNTLTGTTGYFKNAVDMTPGFDKGDKTNLQPGGKPYKGPKTNIREFINTYKRKRV